MTAPAAPPPQAQRTRPRRTRARPSPSPCSATTSTRSAAASPSRRSARRRPGSATTDGSNVTFTPNPDFFGPASFIYRIRDGANTAQREAEAQVAVTVIGQPSAPGTPIAREGNATATVTWAAPPSNGAPIDDYELRIEGGSSVSVGTATGYTWDGLANGVPVSFSVRAHNSAGWGPWSGPSPAVTPDIEPGRPAAPTVQFADRALIVTWSPPANEGSAITNYDIQIGGDTSAVQRIGATTQFRWEGLTNGQEYTFQVRAVNAKGEGEFSSPSAPEHPLRPPDAPGAPVGERGDKTITVNWGAPGNGGDPIIEYQVQILSSGATNTTTGTSIRWANLPNGQPQQFQVRARNRADWGPWSPASAAVVPCGVPDAPANVAATRGDQSAGVTWSAPNNQGCAITAYTVRANGGGGTNVGGGQTSATVGGLSNGTSYTFTVIARNEVGDSAPSPASNAVMPAGPPGAPQITSAEPAIRQVTSRGTAAYANGARSPRYQLSVNGGGWKNVGNGTSTTRTGLADGTQYSFQVRAVNDVGPGRRQQHRQRQHPGRAGAGRRPRRRRRGPAHRRQLVGAERTAIRPGPMRGVSAGRSSPAWRGSRNHQASMGHGKSTTCSPAWARAFDPRPSQATVRSAASSPVAPSAVRYATPVTRPAASRRRSVTSVLRRSVNVGSASAASASRSRRSHCGTIAT